MEGRDSFPLIICQNRRPVKSREANSIESGMRIWYSTYQKTAGFKTKMKEGQTMKKIIALILVLAAVSCVFGAQATTYYWYEGGYWHSYSDGNQAYDWQKPKEWKEYMVNYNFPDWVIQDVSAVCNQYHGSYIGWLGLVSTSGSNLRTGPKLGNSYRGIQLHDSTTVYVYFSFVDASNREWYYATTADGHHGFLVAKFIRLIPVSR